MNKYLGFAQGKADSQEFSFDPANPKYLVISKEAGRYRLQERHGRNRAFLKGTKKRVRAEYLSLKTKMAQIYILSNVTEKSYSLVRFRNPRPKGVVMWDWLCRSRMGLAESPLTAIPYLEL